MPSRATIPYDKPVADYIAGLDATKHITHKTFTKKSVTLHHNGSPGLSHDAILNIWKDRPASAHFDVNASGAVAQYARVNEFAWSTGNLRGNQESISIEMANSTGKPTYKVSDTTWKASARLAGWLFANVIHDRPTAANLHVHSYWSATACAGPYVKSIFPQILAEVQHQYAIFTGTAAPATTTNPGGLDMAITIDDIKKAIESVLCDWKLVAARYDDKGNVTEKWSVTHRLDWLGRVAMDTEHMSKAALAQGAANAAAIKALAEKVGVSPVDLKAITDAASQAVTDAIDAKITSADVALSVNGPQAG